MVQKGVQCFRYREERYKKWECPRMKKEIRMEEKVVPPCNVWRNVKKHCEAKGFPPREARMSMKE